MSMIGSAVQQAMQSAATISRVLKTGMTGPDVASVQSALNSMMGAGLGADGSFGPKTYNAVKAFQQAYYLTADGIVGAQTAGAMGFTFTGPSSPSAASAAAAGAGGAVLEFQQALMHTLRTSDLPQSVVQQTIQQVAQTVQGQILPSVQSGANGVIDRAAGAASNVFNQNLVNQGANVAHNVVNNTAAGAQNIVGNAQNAAQQVYGLAANLYDQGVNNPMVSGVISEFERGLTGVQNIWDNTPNPFGGFSW